MNEVIFTFSNSITKKFSNKNFLRKEIFIYSKDIPFIPELLSFDENSITISKIEGKNIGEMKDPNFKKLGLLLANFHGIKKNKDKVICHFDTNPKNYLFDGKNYFIIDFENIVMDFAETDIIHFLLFWAHILEFEEFQKCVQNFLLGYCLKNSIDIIRWSQLFSSILHRFNDRRKTFNKTENKNNKCLNKNLECLKNYNFGFEK